MGRMRHEGRSFIGDLTAHLDMRGHHVDTACTAFSQSSPVVSKQEPKHDERRRRPAARHRPRVWIQTTTPTLMSAWLGSFANCLL